MNKLFIDNNRTKNYTNNLNIILIKNKFTNTINCINISTGSIRRRNKPNITTKNFNILINLSHWIRHADHVAPSIRKSWQSLR
jgi:hypothetical protein